MTSTRDLRSWMFSSLVADEVLQRLEQEGMAVRPDNDPGVVQRVLPLESFSRDVRHAAMKALPAYLALFCLENAIRELVAERLSENHGSDWWETCAPAGVRNKAAERKEKEGKSRWHAQRGAHPINYTDFGDLKSLIANNWAGFEDLLPDLNWVNSRLDELEASRNIIAHSNVLEQREIDRMRLYLEDWTRQVG